MITFEQLEEYINKCSYNETQKQETLSKVEEMKPKIKSILACFTYNKDYGKKLSILTTPDYGLEFEFKKDE